ncbi:CTM1 [Candida jiufengensis]|uniref:CTM1 n=1 Tax=Candida jiufengensis TaxID=497108 RepID=UPI002224FCE4|nr:CTM1 [Candida jiufengensis]KAI5957329.1 CTM1 [Candida jiufengensis]
MPVKISKDVRIPGIDNNDKFAKWVDSKCQSNLTIDHSLLGGIGLFYESTEEVQDDEDQIILRIPPTSVYNMDTLLDLLSELKKRDKQHTEDAPIIESQLINNLLKILQPESETIIIFSYLLGLKILQNYRNSHKGNVDYYINSPSVEFDTYLQILSNTSTYCPSEEEAQQQEPKIKHFNQLNQLLQSEYDELMSGLSELYPDVRIKELLPYQTFFQIYRALTSRTLEIPKAIQEEGDEDNFTTNITLVPILDYVNHNNPNNAYFDIDRKTNDIVLKLKNNEIPRDNTKLEITISYDTDDQTDEFFITYGFTPDS